MLDKQIELRAWRDKKAQNGTSSNTFFQVWLGSLFAANRSFRPSPSRGHTTPMRLVGFGHATLFKLTLSSICCGMHACGTSFKDSCQTSVASPLGGTPVPNAMFPPPLADLGEYSHGRAMRAQAGDEHASSLKMLIDRLATVGSRPFVVAATCTASFQKSVVINEGR